MNCPYRIFPPFGGTCLSGPLFSEGRACHVRRSTIGSTIAFRRARQACPSDPSEGPACQVRQLTLGHPFPFPGTTSVPLRAFGGTCLSGPLFSEGRACHVRHSTIGSTMAVHRGLKSRAESGAQAPHSLECGDSSPLSGEGFSLHHLAVSGVLPQPRKRAPGRGNP